MPLNAFILDPARANQVIEEWRNTPGLELYADTLERAINNPTYRD